MSGLYPRVFSIVACLAYSAILPLWEGFDEPFHYGYTVEISRLGRIPQLGKSMLSEEIWNSMQLAPASHIVVRNIPQLIAFDVFQRWPQQERDRVRERLVCLDPALGAVLSDSPNYEAHHPPLGYLLLALPDRLLAQYPILTRIWILRSLLGLIGVCVLHFGIARLARSVGLPQPFAEAAFFCMITCQMTLAAFSHISNDYIAVSLYFVLTAQMLEYSKSPTLRGALSVGMVLGLGLLSKAYFLALMVPVFIVVGISPASPALVAMKLGCAGIGVAALAGPWYLRNQFLYGNLSGMVEAARGVSLRDLLVAVPQVPWVDSIQYFIHAMVWTGNNSFLAFSRATVDVFLTLLAIGVLATLVRFRRITMIWPIALQSAFFVAALLYATVQSYVFTNGASHGPSPWYGTPLLITMIFVAFTGFSLSGQWGRLCSRLMIGLSLYMFWSTFWVKLLPLYGGLYGRKVTLAVLVDWYTSPQWWKILATTAPRPVAVGLALVCAATLWATFNGVKLIWGIVPESETKNVMQAQAGTG